MIIINKIKNYLDLDHSRCFTEMKRQGYVFDSCSGVVGGDYNTNYLAYQCVGCKYLTMDSNKNIGDY